MKISFDLDNTLICDPLTVPHEPRLPWYLRLLAGDERLRSGTPALMAELQKRGWEIWIYTTSFREPGTLHRWFRCYGITVKGIINQRVHDEYLKGDPSDRPPSKNPGAFGIDLHIDDLDGVRIEGERFGFKVLVVKPDDSLWTAKVLSAVDGFRTSG